MPSSNKLHFYLSIHSVPLCTVTDSDVKSNDKFGWLRPPQRRGDGGTASPYDSGWAA